MSKSNLTENKRRHLLGEAICGFVNAETTDEACYAILTGIQKTSGFSSSFMEEVKKVFPAIGNIEPPPKNSMEEETSLLHWVIRNEQKNMREFFDSLLHGKKTISFSIYLSIYNELSKSIERRANPINIELRDGSRDGVTLS